MTSQQLAKLKLPNTPGVYFFKDGKGKTLYIGRATSLRDRVRSYFNDDVIATRGPRIVDMVSKAKTVAFEKTDSVLEAVILEGNLIKRYQPKFNTDEKDDKSYNYIIITDEEYPRVLLVRQRTLDKMELEKRNVNAPRRAEAFSAPSKRVGKGLVPDGKGHRPGYQKAFKIKRKFGPYPSGGLLRDALKIIRRIFPFLDERSTDPAHRRFYASIGLAPELGGASREEYLKTVRNICLLLDGRKKAILKALKKEMMDHAKRHEFEAAGRAKRTLYALEHIEDVALIKGERGTGGGFRIEAYDIAHLSGKAVVGVMTVVENGEPAKSEYRKFKISREKNDDAAALTEVLSRRLGHPEWPYPSLIVVDGGEIQLNAARRLLASLKSDIPVVSVVKDDKHKARGILADPSFTKANPTMLSQYKRAVILANAEAHRFAITYHKKVRARNFL